MTKEEIVKNLSNVKIVIGNGFDLFCGLKTSYSQFFNNDLSLVDTIEKWIKSFEHQQRYYDYLNDKIANHEEFASSITLPEKITVWDIFFYLCSQVNKNQEILWCDIEAKMADSLATTEKYRFFSWGYVLSICNNNNFRGTNTKELLCACYVKSKLGFRITTETFYEFLYHELEKFEKRFGSYIKNQLLNKSYKKNAITTINKLINLEKNNPLNIDTFNYSTFEIEGIILNHINGTYSNPIFGIDYSYIRDMDKRYVFTKIYRRLEQSFLTDTTESCSYVFDNVIIFGHSLNKQDYNYFFPLFDNLNITNPSFKGKLVFAYSVYDTNKKHQIKRNLLLNVAKLLREYEIYSKGKDENRLLEILNFNGCIVYYPIKNDDLEIVDY